MVLAVFLEESPFVSFVFSASKGILEEEVTTSCLGFGSPSILHPASATFQGRLKKELLEDPRYLLGPLLGC